MKRRLFSSHSPSNLGSATLETHADCRRADCSVNPGNVHDSLHFFDENEKKDKKTPVTIVLFNFVAWFLHVACLFPIAMMPVMFCFAVYRCVFLFCHWICEKQSQPTWCFRDSLLHCIALPVTCCFSIGSIISHSFPAFQINLPFFKATIPLAARQQFPDNNPSWVKIFLILSKGRKRHTVMWPTRYVVKIA